MKLAILKNRFARFVHRHGMARHFHRLAIWEAVWAALQPPQAPRELPPALIGRLLEASRSDAGSLLASLGSGAQGLSAARAAAIRRRTGTNEVGHDRPPTWWQHLWHCYRNPFSLLLSLLAVISLYTGERNAAIPIATMVLLSTGIRFAQERRSGQAADRLKAMVGNQASVLRPDPQGGAPRQIEVAIRELVPGDIVVLSAGDMIPAELRVLQAKDLFVSQAAMTGESLPLEKYPQAPSAGSDPLALENLLFMGTNVVSGAAQAVVVEIGERTFFGALARQAGRLERAPTAFQGGVNQVSWLLLRFMLVMVPVVLLINGFTKGDWVQAFLFTLSVAVGLTPEMLPMIVTSTLARGAVALSRRKVIVKRLDAIQDFGAMTVLCADKTGTLTQDRICLQRHTDADGNDCEEVLRLAYLNSHYQTGLRNLLDVAVLEHAEVHTELGIPVNYRKVDEIPFDFQRRRMSVVVSERDDHHELICKGAVDEVLAVCTRVREAGGEVDLDAARLARIRATTDALNEQGLRVVAVAVREEPPLRHVYSVADEAGLTLVGYVAFLDPPKESSAPALRALAAHGIEVKILSGDNERVTAKICREVGLAQRGIVLGEQVQAMSDAQLTRAVAEHNVFARLNPAQKERIVTTLRRCGEVVGFMGDGINDAPALRAADIGISVDSAVDIAREAADIILLEKSLMVLDEGVLEGRRTFANMLNYIRMAVSSNFGNVLSVLLASAFLPFLPMLPLQLLVQNLLYDLSQTAIPFDNIDPERLQAPSHWAPQDIGRFMLWFGPVSSVFDLATFAVMAQVFGAATLAGQALFQSGWFIEGLLSQVLVVHLIRTRRLPFVQSRAAWPVFAMGAAVAAVGIFLPMGPLAPDLGMQPLPATYFGWLGAILLSYVMLAQGVKTLYAKHHRWQ